MDEASAPRIRERRVREEHLPRVEAARVVALLLGPRAEEGDLEAERAIQPAGDVPPFGAELRMRAVIARENERAWRDARVVDLFRAREQGKKAESEKPAPLHQSSRTARTGPMPIASRPETIAVTTASATRMPISQPSSANGGCRSIVQLNDWRF